LGCELLTVPINSEFKVTVKELKAAQEDLFRKRGKKVRAIILSSPSNPTGAMLTPQELKGMKAVVILMIAASWGCIMVVSLGWL